jgi:hypothetical protein
LNPFILLVFELCSTKNRKSLSETINNEFVKVRLFGIGIGHSHVTDELSASSVKSEELGIIILDTFNSFAKQELIAF